MNKKLIVLMVICLLGQHAIGQKKCKEVLKADRTSKTSEIYHVRKDDPECKEGKYEFRYQRKAQIKGFYQNNKKTGRWIYSPNKNFKIVGVYDEDKREGEWVYTLNDNVISVLNYSNGKLEGMQKGYYEDGAIASEMNYKGDKRSGEAKHYSENGKLKKLIHYRKGDFHGENIDYTEDGEVITKVIHENGIPVSLEVREGHEDESNYSGDLKNGTGSIKRLFRKDGEVIVLWERNLKDSLLHGKITGYHLDGKKSFEGQYENGYMTGRWIFYNKLGTIDHYNVYLASDKLKVDKKEPALLNLNESDVDIREMPMFGEDGSLGYQRYVARMVRYPVECLKNSITGRVNVSFVVNKLGEIIDMKVTQSAHPLLDQEAMRVISMSPLWTPGLMKRIPVKVSYTVPINFALQ